MTQDGQQQPWQLFPDIWKTEGAFWAYVRGGIRNGLWKRMPAKLEWKKTQMVVPPEDYKGRAKSLGTCHYCHQAFPASHLEVDHVRQAGSCNSWETMSQFVYNLLDCNGNWVLACKPCHKIKSLAERQGTTFEQAAAEKKAIEWMKKPVKDVLAFCVEHGYNAKLLTNATKRREALSEIFKKGESNG
jgi:glutaredoxin